jgi:signal transduction histidine kinase
VTSSSSPSLRLRLAAVGLVGVLVPLLVLLAVSLVSDETTTTTASADVTERTRGLSPWVPVTAALLAVPAAVGAWWWAGRAVGPIRRITTVADDIQATSLDRRIHLADAPAEVQALADSFDRMLDRLAAASDVQRRLVEDTSHQLRTPLAVLATNADVALADPDATTDDLRDALRSTRATVDRLCTIVDDLLADARAQHHTAAGAGNDLVVIATHARDVYADAAHARGVDIRVTAPPQLTAAVDGPSVARSVGSLIDNAIRHSPPGGVVAVEVGTTDGRAFVAVTDQGPGIDAEHRDRIFDRYWSTGSAPHAASADDERLGIGLAVVRQVGDAHEGVVVESPLGPEGGTRFTLRFRT